MVRVTLGALGIALGLGAAARAADQPVYAAPPAWVHPISIPRDGKASGAAVDVLLWTSQSRLTAGVTETFVEQASRINSAEGLGHVGSLTYVWNPASATLTIHRARILRAGEVIDLLAAGRKFTVLRRETNLEAAILDGALTATFQPEGLRVGDVLDVAATLVDREPALAGHAEAVTGVAHRGTIGRLYASLAWPSDLPVRVWRTDDLPDLKPVPKGTWTTVELDQTNTVSPDPPSGAPPFEQMLGVLQASDFGSWKAVSAAAYPLYEKAATLKSDSPLLVEAARIRAESADPKAEALAALKLVEGQTRYFYIGLNAGGFTPAPADLTWTRRFGDCKGKTVVLVALLNKLGIKAEAALVNTVGGDGLDRIAPRYQAFDHVIVRAEIAGHIYWLDGTRIGDEDLDILPVPNYHWALPLRAQGADLEPLRPRPPSLPLAEIVERIDARAGIDNPAIVHKDMIARGDGALFLNLSLKQASSVDRDKALKVMLTAGQGWLKPSAVAFTYDPLKMEARASLEGTGLLPFTSAVGASSNSRDWMVDGGSIDAAEDFTRLSDYHREAPYAVNYPAYAREEVEVRLPDGGKGFEVFNGGGIDTTVGGVAYARAAAIVDGRLTVMTSTQAVASTFPARDAAAIQAALRNLSSYDVSIRYEPPSASAAKTSTDNMAETAATAATAPRTPLETAQAAFADQDYAKAETAFTAALIASPSAKLYYDRAAARVALGKDTLAQADLQAALKLNPKDSFALFALGRLGLRHGDLAKAATYFAAAAAASPEADAIGERIAKAYDAEGRYAQALLFWDRAAKAAIDPEARARALRASCWSRARAGVELDRALQDCDASLKIHPDASSALNARGLAELRAGAPDKALVDYDAALTRAPNTPTSLYGRALAEFKLGQSVKAAADLAKAREIDPTVDTVVSRWGLAPPPQTRATP